VVFLSALIGNEVDQRSLYERANGYNYDAVKIFMPAGSKQPIVVHYTEHCPPDVGAAFIWLKNRDPDRWRDVQNVDHVLGKYIISDHPMTEEEWARERATVVERSLYERANGYSYDAVKIFMAGNNRCSFTTSSTVHLMSGLLLFG
jgi:hypothetical protein